MFHQFWRGWTADPEYIIAVRHNVAPPSPGIVRLVLTSLVRVLVGLRARRRLRFGLHAIQVHGICEQNAELLPEYSRLHKVRTPGWVGRGG